MRSIHIVGGLLSALFFVHGAVAGLIPGTERKIGVLVPVTGEDRSLAALVTAGLEHGINTLRSNWSDGVQVRLVIPGEKFSGLMTKEVFEHLANQGVDAMIGGVTPASAHELLMVAASSEIPTIVLEDSDASAGMDSYPGHILRVGRSREEVYRESVAKWIKNQKLKKIAVIYDLANDLTFRYGAEVTPEIFDSLQDEVDFVEVFFNGDYIQGYDPEIEAIKAANADGVIVSASQRNAANFVKEVAEEVGPKPIFAAPPIDARDRIEDLAAYGALPVFYGIQFSPDIVEESASWLAKAMGDDPNESGGRATLAAVKAYYAVQVLGEAWKLDSDWPAGGSPWQQVGEVDGLSGWLADRDELTFVGPLTVDVVEVTP